MVNGVGGSTVINNAIFLRADLDRVLAVNAAALAATSLAFGWLGFVQFGRYVVLGAFALAISVPFVRGHH